MVILYNVHSMKISVTFYNTYHIMYFFYYEQSDRLRLAKVYKCTHYSEKGHMALQKDLLSTNASYMTVMCTEYKVMKYTMIYNELLD